MQNIQKPLLSISILVSNRIDTIEKCMESIRPLLESFPCELVAVDTVGENTDGSIEIVRKYTDKIYYFEWCNDFAAARNFGLEKCIGEWFMFMDDDEWFEDVGEIVEFFQSGEYKNYESATYQIRNYTTIDGNNWNMAVLSRMVRRTAKLRFTGSIHEAFSNMKLPCRDFSSFVHHYGYAYANEEEKLAHLKRNISLLEVELQKNPGDLRYRAQMAMELASFDNDRALKFCEETLQTFPEEKNSIYLQWILSLVFRLYEAMGVSIEAAESSYFQLKHCFGFFETTENAISFQMVRLFLLNNQPAKAYPYAEQYFSTWEYLHKNMELRQRQMAADSYRYQTEEAYREMLHFGAYSAWQAGAFSTAWNWYAKMPWESENFQNEEAFNLLLGLFQTYPDVRMMVDILKRLMKNMFMMKKDTVRKNVAEVLAMLK